MKRILNAFVCTHSRLRAQILRAICLSLACLFSLLLFGCKGTVNYFDYVSELRNNILLGQADGIRLTAYAVTRETPYLADGIPQTKTTTAEFRVSAPAGETAISLAFAFEGKDYGGEMSFDNVKMQFYYSCSLDISAVCELPVTVIVGDSKVEITAQTVITENTLTPEQLLKTLASAEPQLFKDLTDKYGFAGEIYLRLIHEDANYYYVGIIDRTQKIRAFLLNAETGKILAKRQS